MADASGAARTAGVVALGGLALHQLRYLLAHGSEAGQALAHDGHGYLGTLTPLLGGVALAIVAATLLAPVLLPAARGERRTPPCLEVRSALLAAALLAVFALQELIEGAVAPGHAGGVAAVLACGGWLALPLSIVLGAIGALVLGGLDGAERLVAERVRAAVRHRPPRRQSTPRPPARLRAPLASHPLAFGLARRPPPVRALA